MKTKLIDFPMYSLDTSTGIVYYGDKPLRHYGENQGKQWKYFLKHGASGKMRTVSIGRLMATVKYGCSYYQLPKDIMFNWSAGGGLTMRTRQECGKMSYNTVLKREQSIDRIQVLERTQSELSLIKQGYQGNIEPLADYMYSKRKHYLHLVQRSRLSAGLGGGKILQEIIDDIISALLLNVVSGTKNILYIEPWIIRSTLAEVKRRKSEKAKTTQYDDNRIYKNR